MGGRPSVVHYENIRNDITEIANQLKTYQSPELREKIKSQPHLKLDELVELLNLKINVALRIFQAIKHGHDRLKALTSGPRCDGAPTLFSHQKCSNVEARWVPFTTLPDKSLSENSKWFYYYNKFKTYYLKELKGSAAMVRQLKRAKSKKSTRQIETRAKSKMPAIIARTSQLYQTVLLTPAHTKASVEAMYENLAKEAAQREAMTAAAISSRTDNL